MGVAWSFGVSEDVITEYGGATLGAYLTDPAVLLETAALARQQMSAAFGEELFREPWATAHGFLESEALGSVIERPEDAWPAPARPLLAEPEDLERLALVTDFLSRPCTRILRDMRSVLQAKLGPRAGGLHEGLVGNGPITTARNLRGDRIFLDFYDRPAWCHKLLAFLTENHILCTRDLYRYQGNERWIFFHIADDFAGMLPPRLFEEFAVPYWKRAFEALGRGCDQVMLHSELMRPEHLPLLRDLPITIVDYGQDPFIAPEQALASGFETCWHFLDKELLVGTPESIRRLYARFVGSGIRSIKLTLGHRRTPVENVKALLEAARAAE
jgi:uroporphyrinogen-III decarboxylase